MKTRSPHNKECRPSSPRFLRILDQCVACSRNVSSSTSYKLAMSAHNFSKLIRIWSPSINEPIPGLISQTLLPHLPYSELVHQYPWLNCFHRYMRTLLLLPGTFKYPWLRHITWSQVPLLSQLISLDPRCHSELSQLISLYPRCHYELSQLISLYPKYHFELR